MSRRPLRSGETEDSPGPGTAHLGGMEFSNVSLGLEDYNLESKFLHPCLVPNASNLCKKVIKILIYLREGRENVREKPATKASRY